jgi:GNAT superfamily N-acetyltransferase
MRQTIPLAENLIDELFPFWSATFGGEAFDVDRAFFRGVEERSSRGTLYLQRTDEELAGACLLVHSQNVPALAGLGEVATAPRFRGGGIATELCRQALADFRAAGGEALFLGTVNPAAARIYHRLGWRKLAGANLMVNITSGASPEEFLVDYFRPPGQVTVSRAGPEVRIPMIPLILTPHDSPVLDANVDLHSIRYRVQNSCLGLYPRYVRRMLDRQGAFFAARSADGRVVGLASALPTDTGGCQIDGFAHHRFAAVWPDLIAAACTWARMQGNVTLQAVLSADDERKPAILAALGFVCVGPSDNFAENRLTHWQPSNDRSIR